jgi:hypothetical protein
VYKQTIIECGVSDDADYEWIFEQAMHNTLSNYFDVTKKMNIDAEFTKSFEDNLVSGLTLKVEAKFKDQVDLAAFKLACGDDLPHWKYNEKEMRFV